MIQRLAGVGSDFANCYLVLKDGSQKGVLIDPGTCNDYLCKSIDIFSPRGISFILLTHGHYDHMLGANMLREKYGAKIGIHPLDRNMLYDPDMSLANAVGRWQTPFDADFFFEDGDVLNLGSVEFRVMNTPGHTPGSCLFITGDAILTGDTIFNIAYGRTDLPGGDMEEMKRSLIRIANIKGNYRLYPGHGPETELDFERKNNRWLRRHYVIDS